MKNAKFFSAAIVLVLYLFMLPAVSFSREIPPIVSVNWLGKNISNPKIVILDIRRVEDYRRGHIPGAVSACYRVWACGTREVSGLVRESLPPRDDLFEAIGEAGIRPESLVVIVCSASHCYYEVEGARVACTLEYAGLKNIGILDGGFEEWARQKKPVSTEFVKPKETTYKGTLNKAMLADREYVKRNLGKAVFVDVREPLPGVKAAEGKRGIIPGSVNLPITEAFTKSGTFKPVEELNALAVKTVGEDKSKPIVTYCDSGRCCPTWAFLLREVLGYKNVRAYDGRLEEWSSTGTPK